MDAVYAGNPRQLIDPYLEMDVRRCRFCGEVVSSKHSVGLFTPQANFDNLAARLSLLLQLPISANDSLSKFACRLCQSSLENLEARLAERRSAVRAVYQRAGYVTGVARISLAQIPPNQVSSTLKRPKDTSGGPGISSHCQSSTTNQKTHSQPHSISTGYKILT